MRNVFWVGVSVLISMLGVLLVIFIRNTPQAIQPAAVAGAERPILARQALSVRHAELRLAPTFTPTSTSTATPQPTTTPTATPLPTATPTATPLPGSGPTMAGDLVIQTQRFDLYIGINTLSWQQVQPLLPQIEHALDQAETALQSGLVERSSVALYQIARRPYVGVRALAYTEERRMELYYSAYEDADGMVRVIVHELGHQYEADRYGQAIQQQADIILHEGLATWLAGTEWLKPYGVTTWPERARQLQTAGRLRSLLDDPSGAAANDAYEGWAAFVDYLITTYGWDAFDDLYCSSRGRATGSAHYREVYGKSLDELATEWRLSLALQ